MHLPPNMGRNNIKYIIFLTTLNLILWFLYLKFIYIYILRKYVMMYVIKEFISLFIWCKWWFAYCELRDPLLVSSKAGGPGRHFLSFWMSTRRVHLRIQEFEEYPWTYEEETLTFYRTSDLGRPRTNHRVRNEDDKRMKLKIMGDV